MGIRDINNSLKWGGMSKRRNYSNGEGWKCLKCKKLLCENKNKKDSVIKKYKQYQAISAVFKFWKDNTTLNLLINITRGATFSWMI